MGDEQMDSSNRLDQVSILAQNERARSMVALTMHAAGRPRAAGQPAFRISQRKSLLWSLEQL